MDKTKLGKAQLPSIIAMMIIVGGYAVERIISIGFTPSKSASIVMAMVYTLLLAVVYIIISTSKDYFYGLLAALLGYKMMPPIVSSISQSPDAAMLYYVVKKVAVILFIVLIVKFYEQQERPRAIQPLPLLALMVVIPFATQIGDQLGRYFMSQGLTMLYAYFSAFAAYGVATVIIMGLAYKTTKESVEFVAYFEYIALAINILRRAAVIVVKLSAGAHVSKSYYVWIVLYVALIAFVALVNRSKQKQIENA